MADLTDLASVKSWLGSIASSADDALLSELITGYSAMVEGYLSRTILTANHTRHFGGHDHAAQQLPQWPINSIASLSIDGRAIPARVTEGGNGYWFDHRSIILTGYCFTRGRSNVLVTWNAGYATVPAAIKQAVNELIGVRFALREKMGVASESLAGQTISYSQADMPKSVKTALADYVSVVAL